MGIYIYTLRKGARKSNLGPLFQYKYSERFTSGDYYCHRRNRYVDEGAAQRAREARHHERWEGYAFSGEITGPILVCVEYQEGTAVYRQETPKAIWSDCDNVPGQLVGYLRREGRKNVVDSLETSLLTDRLWLKSYLTENMLWGEVDLTVARAANDPEALLPGLTGWCRAAYDVAYNHWKTPFFINNIVHWPKQGTPGRVTVERLEHIRAHIAGAERRLNPREPKNVIQAIFGT